MGNQKIHARVGRRQMLEVLDRLLLPREQYRTLAPEMLEADTRECICRGEVHAVALV